MSIRALEFTEAEPVAGCRTEHLWWWINCSGGESSEPEVQML